MWTEIVKLTPKMDASALNSMFTNLNRRFVGLAKRFGDGMRNAFKFTGVVALVGAVISKIMNPLERAEELFKKVTGKGDDAMTNAEEFGTDAGKLLRLEALAAAKGLDADTLRTLLGKFQGKLAEEQEKVALPDRLKAQVAAETDPVQKKILEAQLQAAEIAKAQGGMLREFVGETDMADAFFNFIQSMQRLDKSRQTVVQNEIFGEKVRGKSAEFFNATDFADILAKLPSTEALGQAAEKSGKVADLADLLKAIRESENFVKKSSLISEGHAKALDESARLTDQADSETLKRFDELKSTSIAVQELGAKFDKFVTELSANVLPEVVTGMKALSKWLPSVSEAKEKVSGVVDPVLKYAAEFQVQAEDGNLQIQQDIRDLKQWFESTWAEVKSSRIWRTFGGGK